MRAAANLGDVSNTTWSRFENGGVTLTPGIIHAVARAFDWSTAWPTEPPVGDVATPSVDLGPRLERLEGVVRQMLKLMASGGRQSELTLAALADQLERDRPVVEVAD